VKTLAVIIETDNIAFSEYTGTQIRTIIYCTYLGTMHLAQDNRDIMIYSRYDSRFDLCSTQ